MLKRKQVKKEISNQRINEKQIRKKKEKKKKQERNVSSCIGLRGRSFERKCDRYVNYFSFIFVHNSLSNESLLNGPSLNESLLNGLLFNESIYTNACKNKFYYTSRLCIPICACTNVER